jgi:hypothetical protein
MASHQGRVVDVTDSSRPGPTDASQTDAALARAMAEGDAIAVAWDQAVPPGGQTAGTRAEVEHG